MKVLRLISATGAEGCFFLRFVMGGNIGRIVLDNLSHIGHRNSPVLTSKLLILLKPKPLILSLSFDSRLWKNF